MKLKKILFVLDRVFHVILILFYMYFIYLVSSMFSFLPWHDDNGIYFISMLVLWLPLSVTTIFSVMIRFVNNSRDKAIICLEALNAIYIPVIFSLGFIPDIPLWPTQLVGSIGVVTMIIYCIKLILKKYKKNR